MWFRPFTILVLVATGSAGAQTLAGVVRVAETRMPLVNAVVMLISDSSNTVVDSARVDSTGIFYLNGPAPGKYRIEIHSPWGYKAESFKAPPVELAKDALEQREFLVPVAALVLDGAHVERPAVEKGILIDPKYPPDLLKARVEGKVRVQFIVSDKGRVVPSSVRILSSPRVEFSDAVLETLIRAQFYPAQIDNRPVFQLVQQEFNFSLGNRRGFR
jgi:TonB family protein